ncbi:unnamed protein product [Phytophthora fragariaefolia]|uniref:Unnamed protein product n=1 Tax=Phytophthora fragariaefolia TaxID=1490495 RepID=A0A9W6X9W9_9STRA|nr:unnamed protein product [Phytophthora fragariaefolia]
MCSTGSVLYGKWPEVWTTWLNRFIVWELPLNPQTCVFNTNPVLLQTSGITYLKRSDRAVSSVCLDDDDEIDLTSPVYHHFLREDSEDITSLTNFSPLEFERLWNSVRAHRAEHGNVGRGRKSKQQPKDVLLMFLAVLKHCGKCDIVANVFRIKSDTFQKMVSVFAEIVSPYLYDKYVVSAADKFSMEMLVLGGNTFRHYPSARYATDVTFQQSNMPTGQMKEHHAYYSAKHHIHSYKVEVSVLLNGLALICTPHYPGSETDIEIFRNNHEFHLQNLLKNSAGTDLADDGQLKEQYPDTWVVLADKINPGLAADFRASYRPKSSRCSS